MSYVPLFSLFTRIFHWLPVKTIPCVFVDPVETAHYASGISWVKLVIINNCNFTVAIKRIETTYPVTFYDYASVVHSFLTRGAQLMARNAPEDLPLYLSQGGKAEITICASGLPAKPVFKVCAHSRNLTNPDHSLVIK